jgi:hypothetical protein
MHVGDAVRLASIVLDTLLLQYTYIVTAGAVTHLSIFKASLIVARYNLVQYRIPESVTSWRRLTFKTARFGCLVLLQLLAFISSKRMHLHDRHHVYMRMRALPAVRSSCKHVVVHHIQHNPPTLQWHAAHQQLFYNLHHNTFLLTIWAANSTFLQRSTQM